MADILIRCVNTKTQKVKYLFPDIANNKQLMKSQDNIISDPQYDYKMEMFKNPGKANFSKNGQSSEPVKESFVNSGIKSNPNLNEDIKNYLATCNPPQNNPFDGVEIGCCNNKINSTENTIIKPKRKRRTKEEMKQFKQKNNA